jgi:hypothetical protein
MKMNNKFPHVYDIPLINRKTIIKILLDSCLCVITAKNSKLKTRTFLIYNSNS